MAGKSDPLDRLSSWDGVAFSGLPPTVQTDKTHRNTWWMEVGCKAYEEDGDMRAWGTTGGTTERRPSRTRRPGHRGFTAGRRRVEIVRAMAARQAWW
jgi:hypothetical protein